MLSISKLAMSAVVVAFTSSHVSDAATAAAIAAAHHRRASMNSSKEGVQEGLPQTSEGRFKVVLDKQNVPVEVNGRVVAHKTAYFGTIRVGSPNYQTFSVVFDTGSAHIFLPSSMCAAESCLDHRRYDRNLSDSAVDIDHDGEPVAAGSTDRDLVSINYGTGEILGEFVNEIVCVDTLGTGLNPIPAVGEDNCVRVRLICAREMSTEPFRQFQFDGVLGLGLDALALNPEFNFFGQMARGGQVEPVFGVFLASQEEDNSEITFGGHDEARTASALQWVPVSSPEKGYWQIAVKGVRVGTEDLDICNQGDCIAIVDTGTSLLGVPKADANALHLRLARRLTEDTPKNIDCREHPGPALIFDMGDFSVDLEASDYSRPAAMTVKASATASKEEQVICRASLLPVEMPTLGPKVFLWGEPVLKKYYTAFDAGRQRVGFAPVKQKKLSAEVAEFSDAQKAVV